MTQKCPTCGGRKQDHSENLWSAHIKMHESYKEVQKNIEKLKRRYPLRNK